MGFTPRIYGASGVDSTNYNLGLYAVHVNGARERAGDRRISSEWSPPMAETVNASGLNEYFRDPGILVAHVFDPVLDDDALVWPVIMQRRLEKRDG